MRNQDEDTSKVKHRTIKPKGATVERKSRRHCNYSDGVISEKNVVVSSNSIDFNLLMIKGGSGKKPRIIWPKAKEWSHFLSANNDKNTYKMLLPVHEREKRNEKSFTTVRVGTCKETIIDSVYEK